LAADVVADSRQRRGVGIAKRAAGVGSGMMRRRAMPEGATREFDEIVSGNAAWDESIQKLNPSFLPELAQGQHPLCLRFGCSDSRVPPDTICGAVPGTLFVHRNIADLTSDTDPSFLAVLQYAVEALQVPHIAVCGHMNCGGLGAVLDELVTGHVGRWLMPAREVFERNRREFEVIQDRVERINRLAELNVLAQVRTIVRSPIVQRAWERRLTLTIHALLYEMETGLLRELGGAISGPPGEREAGGKPVDRGGGAGRL
jgi:carbonic anhydrase